MTSQLEREDLAAIVRAALLAPSGDNCQPWRFVWDATHLNVHFVPNRAESLYDTAQTASWIALGAALVNMRLTAQELGWRMQTELFPANTTPNLAARISLEAATPLRDPLCAAITTRCVNRRPYVASPLPNDVRNELQAAVQDTPGAQLDLVEQPREKSALARLASLNERLLFENRSLHDGLYRWLRWTADEAAHSGDGMPIETLELAPLERPGFRLLGSWTVARTAGLVGLTRALPLRTQQIYRRSAAIGLLSVSGSSREDVVAGGEALQRLWLTCARRGVAFQPITGVVCLLWRCRLSGGEGLSPAHRRLIEAGGRALARLLPNSERRMPIMLFRLGTASAPSARAPRRPVDTVLTCR